MIYPYTYQSNYIGLKFKFPEGVTHSPIPLANCGAFHDRYLPDVERTAEELEFINLCKNSEQSFIWKGYKCEKIYSDWACTILRSNCPYERWITDTMCGFNIRDLYPIYNSTSDGLYAYHLDLLSNTFILKRLSDTWDDCKYVYAYTHGVSFKDIADNGFYDPLSEGSNERIFGYPEVENNGTVPYSANVIISNYPNPLAGIYPFAHIVNMHSLGRPSEISIEMYTKLASTKMEVSPRQNRGNYELNMGLKTIYNSNSIAIIYGYYSVSCSIDGRPSTYNRVELTSSSPVALIVEYSKMDDSFMKRGGI